MATIEVKVEIDASVDRVWDVISDIDGEPRFWKGTKSVRNISKDGNRTSREIIIAFRDQKCLQEVTMFPKERIEAKFTKGIIDGKKTIYLESRDGKTILRTEWEMRLNGMMGMFTVMIKKHIKSGTEQAMQSIRDEAEK